MEAVTEKFTENPLVLSEDKKKLTISITTLNQELEPYSIRVDPADIKIDEEASRLNNATVVVINGYDTSPGSDFDVAEFFDKSLEDKFEATDAVYSANVDKGDYVITLVLNGQDVEVIKEYESGGLIEAEGDIEPYVDKKLKEAPHELFTLLNIEPASTKKKADVEKKTAEAREKAIEYYGLELKNRQSKKPTFVFYDGRKIDLTNGVGPANLYLHNKITEKILDRVVAKAGENPDMEYCKNYAKQKTLFVFDNIMGLASMSKETLRLNDTLIGQEIDRQIPS